MLARMERSLYLSLLQALAMAAVYFTAGKLSFLVSQENLIITIVIFAAEGFALAGVILFGYAVIPGIFLGQLLLALNEGIPVLAALSIATINSTEAIIALLLFYRFGFDKALPTIRDVLGLLLLIVCILQPFSAVLNNLVLFWSSVISWQDYPKSVFSWWFGNLMGQILVTHMILLLYANIPKIKWGDLLIVILFFGLLRYLFQVVIAIENTSLLLSFTLLLVVLLASYKGVHYATVATAVIAIVSTYTTSVGTSVLAEAGSADRLIDLNFYILSHILLALIIGTLFREKDVALEQLKCNRSPPPSLQKHENGVLFVQ
jgi:hypothetical protein